MKKTFISFILIFLAQFFTVNSAYCEEDFFTNPQNFKEAPKITSDKVKKSIEKTKPEKKFSFNFFKKKKTQEEENQGYYGKLPDIEKDFEYKKENIPLTPQIDMKIPTSEELNEENLKKAPFEDDLFLDMIIKKEETSEYLKDIQKIKFSLNNLKKCLENEGNIQHFNGAVNDLELRVQNLKKKYENKSEALKESYIHLLNTNYYAKVLGNLKYDANYYSRYVPVQEGQYSKENISLKEKELLDYINKSLFLLNNEE